jgi:sec-independent protein translocase protein TatA
MGGWEAPWHWVVLAILVIALFGYKKLPDAARSVGRSLRIFKTEIKGMSEDDKKRESSDAAPKQVEGTVATVQPNAPVEQQPVQPEPVASQPPAQSLQPQQPAATEPVNVNGTPADKPSTG